MQFIVDLTAILCTVSMTGTEFAVAALVNPALEQLDQATWMNAIPALARVLGKVMPVWYGLGMLLLAVDAFLHSGGLAGTFLDVALILWIGGIVYSITMLVPINNRIAKAHEGIVKFTADHKRWNRLHRWRVVLLFVAVLCLVGGLLVR